MYSYSQCFSTLSWSITRISSLPLAEKTCLYSQPCHLSPEHGEKLMFLPSFSHLSIFCLGINYFSKLQTQTLLLLLWMLGWLPIVFRIECKLINMILKAEQSIIFSTPFISGYSWTLCFWHQSKRLTFTCKLLNSCFPWAILPINTFLSVFVIHTLSPKSNTIGSEKLSLSIQSNLIALHSVLLLTLCTHSS